MYCMFVYMYRDIRDITKWMLYYYTVFLGQACDPVDDHLIQNWPANAPISRCGKLKKKPKQLKDHFYWPGMEE